MAKMNPRVLLSVALLLVATSVLLTGFTANAASSAASYCYWDSATKQNICVSGTSWFSQPTTSQLPNCPNCPNYSNCPPTQGQWTYVYQQNYQQQTTCLENSKISSYPSYRNYQVPTSQLPNCPYPNYQNYPNCPNYQVPAPQLPKCPNYPNYYYGYPNCPNYQVPTSKLPNCPNYPNYSNYPNCPNYQVQTSQLPKCPNYPNYYYGYYPSHGYEDPITTQTVTATATSYSTVTQTSEVTSTTAIPATVTVTSSATVTSTTTTGDTTSATVTTTATTRDTTAEMLYGSLMAVFLALFLATLVLLVASRSRGSKGSNPRSSQAAVAASGPAYIATSHKCSACGTEVDLGTKFCGNCGAQLRAK
jgi:hypothetical protein